ncbi:MAG: response regulator [Candidatus Acidiferrales bacterium]|jgi:CheY-like chemotaxis protein
MKKRILVADDNPLIRKMLCKIFSDHEALEICDEAVNGQDAIEKAEQHRPDLIILDLAMPVLDGLKASESICKILPGVPIILFTLHAQTLRDFDLKRSGITRVVPKTEMVSLVDHAEELLLVA